MKKELTEEQRKKREGDSVLARLLLAKDEHWTMDFPAFHEADAARRANGDQDKDLFDEIVSAVFAFRAACSRLAKDPADESVLAPTVEALKAGSAAYEKLVEKWRGKGSVQEASAPTPEAPGTRVERK